MQNITIGDVFFVLLVLGIVHGIMALIKKARKRETRSEDDSAAN